MRRSGDAGCRSRRATPQADRARDPVKRQRLEAAAMFLLCSGMVGEIDTLGKAAYRQMALRVSCRPCQRGTYFWANDLAGMYGNHRSPHSLTFRCRECGKTDCEVEFTEIDFDRRPKGIVWVPKKMG